MSSVVPWRSEVTSNNDLPLERRSGADAPGSTMVGLSMAVAFSLASRSRPVCDVPHNT